MKRILLGLAAFAALSLGGLFTSTAEAHGPYCGYRGFAGRGYGFYNGHTPYSAYVPYSAGYSGGWQPYLATPTLIQPQPTYTQPRFGLYLGF